MSSKEYVNIPFHSQDCNKLQIVAFVRRFLTASLLS